MTSLLTACAFFLLRINKTSAQEAVYEPKNALKRLLLLSRNERRPEKATPRPANVREAIGVRLLLGQVAHSHLDSVRRGIVDEGLVNLDRFGEDATLDDDGSLRVFLQRGVRSCGGELGDERTRVSAMRCASIRPWWRMVCWNRERPGIVSGLEFAPSASWQLEGERVLTSEQSGSGVPSRDQGSRS